MRAVEGSLGHSPLINMGDGRIEKTGLAIPCARATRGRGLPSLNARTMGTRVAVPPNTKAEGMKEAFEGHPHIGMDRSSFTK